MQRRMVGLALGMTGLAAFFGGAVLAIRSVGGSLSLDGSQPRCQVDNSCRKGDGAGVLAGTVIMGLGLGGSIYGWILLGRGTKANVEAATPASPEPSPSPTWSLGVAPLPGGGGVAFGMTL